MRLKVLTRQHRIAKLVRQGKGVLMIFGLAASSLTLTRAVEAQAKVGIVLGARGNWILNNGERLSRNSPVPAGGIIHNPSPASFDRITISDMQGKIIVSAICKDAGACEKPIHLPAIVEKRSKQGTSIGTFISWLWGPAIKLTPSPNTERGRGALPDAVVLLKDGQLDLSPVFQEQVAGEYMVVFRTLPRDDAQRKRLGPLTFRWDPVTPRALSVSALRPGLYELALSSSSAEFVPTGKSAWVLVMAPGQYENAATSFREAVALTAEWRGQADSETVSNFLRSYLDFLGGQEPDRAMK